MWFRPCSGACFQLVRQAAAAARVTRVPWQGRSAPGAWPATMSTGLCATAVVRLRRPVGMRDVRGRRTHGRGPGPAEHRPVGRVEDQPLLLRPVLCVPHMGPHQRAVRAERGGPAARVPVPWDAAEHGEVTRGRDADIAEGPRPGGGEAELGAVLLNCRADRQRHRVQGGERRHLGTSHRRRPILRPDRRRPRRGVRRRHARRGARCGPPGDRDRGGVHRQCRARCLRGPAPRPAARCPAVRPGPPGAALLPRGRVPLRRVTGRCGHVRGGGRARFGQPHRQVSQRPVSMSLRTRRDRCSVGDSETALFFS